MKPDYKFIAYFFTGLIISGCILVALGTVIISTIAIRFGWSILVLGELFIITTLILEKYLGSMDIYIKEKEVRK